MRWFGAAHLARFKDRTAHCTETLRHPPPPVVQYRVLAEDMRRHRVQGEWTVEGKRMEIREPAIAVREAHPEDVPRFAKHQDVRMRGSTAPKGPARPANPCAARTA